MTTLTASPDHPSRVTSLTLTLQELWVWCSARLPRNLLAGSHGCARYQGDSNVLESG